MQRTASEGMVGGAMMDVVRCSSRAARIGSSWRNMRSKASIDAIDAPRRLPAQKDRCLSGVKGVTGNLWNQEPSANKDDANIAVLACNNGELQAPGSDIP